MDKIPGVRELPPKKCSFYLEFFHKGGGGVTKSKSFGALFVQILGELGRTKVPKKFEKF